MRNRYGRADEERGEQGERGASGDPMYGHRGNYERTLQQQDDRSFQQGGGASHSRETGGRGYGERDAGNDRGWQQREHPGGQRDFGGNQYGGQRDFGGGQHGQRDFGGNQYGGQRNFGGGQHGQRDFGGNQYGDQRDFGGGQYGGQRDFGGGQRDFGGGNHYGDQRSQYDRGQLDQRGQHAGDYDQYGARSANDSSQRQWSDQARGWSGRQDQDWRSQGAGYGGQEPRFGQSGQSFGSSGGSSGQSASRGRAPKGYKRSDDRIREDLCDHIAERTEIDASEVEVKVQNGEVTLSGSVNERHLKHMLERIAESIPGVTDVRNEIRTQRHDQQRHDQQSESKSTGTESKGFSTGAESKGLGAASGQRSPTGSEPGNHEGRRNISS